MPPRSSSSKPRSRAFNGPGLITAILSRPTTRRAIGDLPALMPGYDWQRYVRSAGLEGKVDSVIVQQPSYFSGLGAVMASTPLPVWKAYFKWQVLSRGGTLSFQGLLPMSDLRSPAACCAESRKTSRAGSAASNCSTATWARRSASCYVEKYFPPQHKARMQLLVANLLEAYRPRHRDAGLDERGNQSRRASQARQDGHQDRLSRSLARLRLHCRFPATTCMAMWFGPWSSNTGATSKNWASPSTATSGACGRRRSMLHYNPTANEITFPAAILQPPFFDAQADDAVNYGGIGGVIGHELSHGFDDQGSQFDADGNLHDWFTAADHDKFAAKTKALIVQYDAYEPVPDYHVNGALTLGENIGDNSGLAIAYKAYRISLAGHAAPVIDGFTGEQRLYLDWVRSGAARCARPRPSSASRPIRTRRRRFAERRPWGIRAGFTPPSASKAATRCICRQGSAREYLVSVNLSAGRALTRGARGLRKWLINLYKMD